MPLPLLRSPADPASSRLIVAVRPAASEFTVIVGVPPARVRTLLADPLLSRTQPPAEVMSVSPKRRLPMILAVSRRTVVSPARSSVLKSAVNPEPSAITLLDQFALTPHRFPLAACVQIPSAAIRHGWADNAAPMSSAPKWVRWGEPRPRILGEERFISLSLCMP